MQLINKIKTLRVRLHNCFLDNSHYDHKWKLTNWFVNFQFFGDETTVYVLKLPKRLNIGDVCYTNIKIISSYYKTNCSEWSKVHDPLLTVGQLLIFIMKIVLFQFS